MMTTNVIRKKRKKLIRKGDIMIQVVYKVMKVYNNDNEPQQIT